MSFQSIEWGSVADWVSGIGSLAAVITALYLSHSSQRVRLDFSCRHMQLVGKHGPVQDIVSFSATNVGSRTTVIRNIGGRVGLIRRRHAVFSLYDRDAYCAGIPKTLIDGETADWGIPFSEDKAWFDSITDRLVFSQWDLLTLRFVIYTSNGGSMSVRPDSAIRKLLKMTLQVKKSLGLQGRTKSNKSTG